MSSDMAIYVVNQLVCLLGLAENGIVLYLLIPSIKKKPFTLYIFNLAVADFGYLICCCLTTTWIFIYEDSGSYFSPQFMLILLFNAGLSFYNASIYYLTIISLGRCLCAIFPLWHWSYYHKKASTLISAILWSYVSVLLGVNLSYCFLKDTVVLVTVIYFVILAVPLSIGCFLIMMKYPVPPGMLFLIAFANSSINPIIYFFVGIYRGGWSKTPPRWFKIPFLHILTERREKASLLGKSGHGPRQIPLTTDAVDLNGKQTPHAMIPETVLELGGGLWTI